jgi:hypothetical protein
MGPSYRIRGVKCHRISQYLATESAELMDPSQAEVAKKDYIISGHRRYNVAFKEPNVECSHANTYVDKYASYDEVVLPSSFRVHKQ